MRILFLGPPGAGKGTQAKTLAKRINLAHIATGDLLRQNVSLGTKLGMEARGFMDKGTLVPDELVTQILSDRLSQPDVKGGFILDGYPRNKNQAASLDDMLRAKNMELNLVFYLDTSEPVIIQRLTGRLVCSLCGANFHIKNMPPKVAMLCDNCGGRLYQRSDDRVETIEKRLQVYLKESHPLIEYYKEKDKLVTVSSDGEPGVVLERMVELIKKYNDNHKV